MLSHEIPMPTPGFPGFETGIMGAMARPRTSALIGRAVEQGRLGDAVASASLGSQRLVLIEGEAGIGKSRLVSEGIDAALGTGDVLAVGHGVELMGDELPFGVITDALRDLVRRIGLDAVRLAAGSLPPETGPAPARSGRQAGSGSGRHLRRVCVSPRASCPGAPCLVVDRRPAVGRLEQPGPARLPGPSPDCPMPVARHDHPEDDGSTPCARLGQVRRRASSPSGECPRSADAAISWRGRRAGHRTAPGRADAANASPAGGALRRCLRPRRGAGDGGAGSFRNGTGVGLNASMLARVGAVVTRGTGPDPGRLARRGAPDAPPAPGGL